MNFTSIQVAAQRKTSVGVENAPEGGIQMKPIMTQRKSKTKGGRRYKTKYAGRGKLISGVHKNPSPPQKSITN